MNAYISHRRIAEFVSARGGARLVRWDSPFPIWATQEYIDAYINAITPPYPFGYIRKTYAPHMG